MTLAHNTTPGWDSPWTPRPPTDLIARIRSNGHGTIHEEESDSHEEEGHEKLGTWARRRKKYRMFMLTNVYVPLVSTDRFPPFFNCATLFLMQGGYSCSDSSI